MPGANSSADDLVEVFAGAEMELRIARDLLESSGIEAFIFDGKTAAMLGSGIVAVAPRLMVYADNAAEARERLRELGFTR